MRPPQNTFELGAVVRHGDGVVILAWLHVHESGSVNFLDEHWGGPLGHFDAGKEGTYWARGAWESVDVVALRAFVALDRSR